jgi:hypothetical protein
VPEGVFWGGLGCAVGGHVVRRLYATAACTGSATAPPGERGPGC